jgi:hypothetical protein
MEDAALRRPNFNLRFSERAVWRCHAQEIDVEQVVNHGAQSIRSHNMGSRSGLVTLLAYEFGPRASSTVRNVSPKQPV